MAVRVVSYYTLGTIYEMIMNNYLRPCLEVLGIPHFICIIQDGGSWEVNASFQPEIIWRAMKTFENEDIVWMDSDIVILDYPHLFNDIPKRCDIGLYYLKYEEHWGGVPYGQDSPKPVLNTGVIYIHNTPKMLKFVEEWMLRCAKDKNKDHRKHFQDLIDESIVDDLSFFLLPRSYAYLAQKEDGKPPVVKMQHPVIVQFQASLIGRKNLYDVSGFDGAL